jgi:CheY-like chemotaxis protein
VEQDELARENEELRRQLDAARREIERINAQADASARAKNAFLANMSHEIRSPLTAVLGYVDLLIEEGNLSRAPRSRLEQLYAIKRNGRHLVRVLADILDFSRLESGKLEVECKPASPFGIVDDVLSVIRPAATGKGLGFDVRYEGALPDRIETDATRLRQILLNLLGNAVKFTEQGGVRLDVALLDHTGAKPTLAFTVTDTGIGIPPAVAEHIFEPFAQADASHSRRFGGSGLGLAISRDLARMLGGDIEMSSSEGTGSCFRATIGVGSLTKARLVEPDADDCVKEFELEELSTLRFVENVADSAVEAHVLVVDDSRDNQRILKHTLTKVGFQVSLAGNGAEALKLVLSTAEIEPFDAILMDMQMPVLDGYEATRRLREAGYEGPILALTAHSMRDEKANCLAAGCDEFIAKPFDRRDLLEKLLQFVAKPRDLHSAARSD